MYATEDPNLRFIATVDGHLLGDIVRGAKQGPMSIDFSLTDDDEPDATYDIEVYVGQPTNGLARHLDTYEWKGNGTGTLDGLEHDRDDQYFYFRIVQYSTLDEGEAVDEARLWTAPIFFQAGSTWPVEGGSDATLDHYVASKESKIYHLDECRYAKRIKPENRQTGADAVKGRTLHVGCPK